MFFSAFLTVLAHLLAPRKHRSEYANSAYARAVRLLKASGEALDARRERDVAYT
jgi:hypothetical protein